MTAKIKVITLDEKIREQLINDYVAIGARILGVYRRPEKNLKLGKANYLNPVFQCDVLSLGNHRGVLSYYKTLRSAIETILETGVIKENSFPWRVVPPYLRDQIS